MARKAPSKCIAVMVGGAIGGFITGVGCGAAIEAIPSVNGSLSTLIAFAIPLVPGLLTSGGAAYAAWGSTPACDNDKKPPDNGGSSGSQIEKSQEQRVIVVLVVMFIAVLLPQVTRLLFSSILNQQAKLIVQIVMAAIAFCTWIIGTYWLYNQGVTARRRRQELSQLGSPEQTQEKQPGVSVRDETIPKTQVYDLIEGFLALRMNDQIATFRAAWEKLSTLPLETLGQLEQAPAVSQGLGFAGESEELLPVVSTISWAVANWPSLSQARNVEDRIVEGARARGSPLALSFALAHYLQERLTSG